MHYRKLSALISFLVVFFFSCKKEGPDLETYYMNAEINGTQTSFTIAMYADTLLASSFLSYFISAHKTVSDSVLLFNLLNYNKTLLVPGTYTGINQLNLYVFYQAGGKEYNNLGFQGFTVEITSVTNTSISGNFHGVVKVQINQTDSVEFSNGHFNVPTLY